MDITVSFYQAKTCLIIDPWFSNEGAFSVVGTNGL